MAAGCRDSCMNVGRCRGLTALCLYHLACALVLGALVGLAVFSVLRKHPTKPLTALSGKLGQGERLGCVPTVPHRFDGGGKVGFVFSATERYSKGLSYRCVAAIESLVRIGGWYGPVYLMAHKGENCFDEAELRRVTGNPNIHVFHDFFKRKTAHNYKIGVLRPGCAKAVKGMMLDLVGESGPDILIYHDCDKVVGVPGCIEDMLRVPIDFGPHAQFYVSHMEPNCIRGGAGNGPCGDNLHAGVVAVHRKYSLPIARAWAQAQLTNARSYDRHTLWRAWNSSRNPDGSPAWPIGSLPPIYRDHMWESFQPSHCINHISGGRCNHNPKSASRAFIQSLCLNTTQPATCTDTRPPTAWCK